MKNFLVVLVIALFSMVGVAQTRDLGSISGCITDKSDAAITGATVVVTNAQMGITRSAPVNGQGCYHFTALPLTGEYSISIEAPSFGKQQQTQLHLRSGRSSKYDFVLYPAAASVNVVVSDRDAEVKSATPQTGKRLDLQTIDNTPVLSRKMSSLAVLDSAARPARGTGDMYISNTLFVINGNGRRQTTFSIDNSTGDDSWGRQALFTTLPFSTVQEFNIVTNALSAEYGRTTGAAINVVTKSGTNAFHGDILGDWRPSSLSATLPLTPPGHRASEAFWQAGATIGGPIVKNRTYFLLSGEYTGQKRDAVITSPLDPGVFTGEFKQALAFARLDHQLTTGNTLTVRVNMDRLSDTNPSDTVGGLALPSAARDFHRDAYSAQLSDRATISPNAFNEARFQFQVASPVVNFEPVTPSPQFSRAGVGTEGESRYARQQNHQYEYADTLLLSQGRHSLKFGVDIIHTVSGGFGQEFGGGFLQGQFTVAPPFALLPISQLTIANISRYTQTFGDQSYRVPETLSAVFAQDDFNLTRRLTLNLGLRYENQTFTDAQLNFAPRVGFAYQLPGDKPTVLRGSYGVFYSELRANLAAGWEINGPEGVVTFQATPGQLGFPTSLAPLPAFPPGAVLPPRDIQIRVGDAAYLNQFFDTSKLRFYPDELVNPYTQQWMFGMEHQIAPGWIFGLDYIGQHTIHIDRPADLNAPDPFVRTAAGQTRSATAADATRPIVPVPNGFRRIEAIVNEGAAYYNGLTARLNKRFSNRFSTQFSYTWSHSIATVDWDGTGSQQEPLESTQLGQAELADSIYDQRHRAVITGWYQFPWQISVGTSTQLASARPYNMTTGVDNNGDGVNNDRAFVNGSVARRNAARSTAIIDVATFVEKAFRLNERVSFSLRGEAFNLINHQNVLVRNGTWGNGATPSAVFGTPIGGINNIDPSRQFQFQARLRF